jgi:uncharacterized membrane protein
MLHVPFNRSALAYPTVRKNVTAAAQTVFTFACYNLTRMATLFGWRLSAT